jgi:hypothetical protein
MNKEEDLAGNPTRRGFLLGLAAAAAVPAFSTASAQTPAAGDAPNREPNTADSAEIDSLMAIVTLKYGAYLKPEELPLVRRSLERQHASVVQLMKVPIHNDDAPDCLFSPDGR